MPKLWNQTIEAHHRDVREAILDTTAALLAQHGPRAATMSRIAEKTGIGRATLYKYFPDVEAILVAWHDRHVAGHLKHLAKLRDQAGAPAKRLRTVLEHYAFIQYKAGRAELAALLHRHEHVVRAQKHLSDLIRDLLTECVKAGYVRSDVATDELATYCIHALNAAGSLKSESAVRRLIEVTVTGLRRR